MRFTKNKDLNFSQDSHRKKCRDAHVKMELTQQTGHCRVKIRAPNQIKDVGDQTTRNDLWRCRQSIKSVLTIWSSSTVIWLVLHLQATTAGYLVDHEKNKIATLCRFFLAHLPLWAWDLRCLTFWYICCTYAICLPLAGLRICVLQMSKKQNSSGRFYPADEPSQLGNNYAVELDAGEELIHCRKHWWQLWWVASPRSHTLCWKRLGFPKTLHHHLQALLTAHQYVGSKPNGGRHWNQD